MEGFDCQGEGERIVDLTRDLCSFRTGVVADDNEALFARMDRELPFELLRWRSGDTHNGWIVRVAPVLSTNAIGWRLRSGSGRLF